jgi:hypothetical protein
MYLNRTPILFSTLLGLTLLGCGPTLTSPDTTTSTDKASNTDTSQAGEFTTISVSVSEKATFGFSLASATAFDMSLTGCASGLSYTGINQNTPNVDLYISDQGCLIELNSFSYGGNSYVPTSGDPFSSYAAGDVATFENSADATETLTVTVDTQLSDPVESTDAVVYTFSQIQAGADELLAESVVGENHTLSVEGVAAPGFTISAVSFDGIASSSGEGQFTFTLECTSTINETTTPYSCEGQGLDQIRYMLVEDTYSGTLTSSEAATIFSNGTPGTYSSGDELAAGAGGTTNGGMYTSSLTGPAQMHNTPNMILILEAEGTSYRYFNVDVSTLSY